ncbi:MAG: Gx transporter family protein [Ruminococcus sp.]|nr:Gx transporter family protein [Ruminococcus sp.]MCD7773831.1 Gx transporter family protein [Ruminococcus sp.]
MYKGIKANYKRLCLAALFLALSIAIFVLESFIPPIGIPGAKLGLSNIITLLALVYLGVRLSACILFLRILITALFCGTVVSFVFSLLGGVFAFIIMSVMIKLLPNKLIWATSVMGAVFHNIGQLLAATIMINNISVWYYLPVLTITALATGVFTGIAAQVTDNRLGKIVREKFC